MTLRGVFGGTFDPIHLGHLRCAWEVAVALDAPVHMIPAREPPHRRPPVASPEQRWEMLTLALAGQQRLLADARELERPGPSYTIDTLASLAAEHPDATLCLVVGADAASGLERWHRWREVLEKAHLVVLTRPGAPGRFTGALARVLAGREVETAAALAGNRPPGLLEFPVTPLDISASAIRRAWRVGAEPRYLTPPAVHEYIAKRRIYTQ